MQDNELDRCAIFEASRQVHDGLGSQYADDRRRSKRSICANMLRFRVFVFHISDSLAQITRKMDILQMEKQWDDTLRWKEASKKETRGAARRTDI